MLAVKRHTDNIGAATQNLDVSRLRAEAVKRALVEQDQVDGTRLKTDGHGASQPKDTNATVEGRGRAIGAPSS
jgi:outer membrane protein OmpA-like peptidoglycan-associated protein